MTIQTTTTSFTPSFVYRSMSSQPKPSPDARAIAEHKWYLSERLDRDVGMRVAELDYHLNVQRPAALVKKTHWFLVLLERLAATHGVRAFAAANYNTRGIPFASPTTRTSGQTATTTNRRAG